MDAVAQPIVRPLFVEDSLVLIPARIRLCPRMQIAIMSYCTCAHLEHELNLATLMAALRQKMLNCTSITRPVAKHWCLGIFNPSDVTFRGLYIGVGSRGAPGAGAPL